ncbi:MAG: hypothetical protein CVT48_06590 [Thermoplasmata archaeon HGW-Thermoplasmata-1]|nr:MAG: hypothetical protein CVT48_06590 [Thermoplasmata archaeon HGW-Thermoplasmata-1]
MAFPKKDGDVFVLGSIILATLLWGSAIPSIKIGYGLFGVDTGDVLSVIVFAGMRFLLASMLILAFMAIRGISFRIERSNILLIAALSVMQTSLHYVLFYNGIIHTSGIKATILGGLGPVALVVMSHFAFRNDRMNARKVLGIATGFAGIVILNLSGLEKIGWSFSIWGEGLILLATFLSGFANIAVKKAHGKMHPVALTAYQMLFGAATMLAVGMMGGASPAKFDYSIGGCGLLLYMAFISGFGFVVWFTMLQRVNVSRISAYKFLIPVFGTILSVVFLAERLRWNHVVALGLVSASIIVINSGRAAKMNAGWGAPSSSEKQSNESQTSTENDEQRI